MSEREDNIDFESSMSDVTPLPQDKHKRFTPPITLKKKPCLAQSHHTHHTLYDYDFNLINQEQWVSGEEKVFFKQTGVQLKIMNNLRRGVYPIEACVDLHHLSAAKAMTEVDQFLDECITHAIRSVLIIHGKGHMSAHEKPILKNILIQHLRQNSNVLAYHSASARHGGTGAIYVLIKASHKV